MLRNLFLICNLIGFVISVPILKSPYLGGDKEHNCCISCGYTWCDTLLECIRTWETECPKLINPFAAAAAED